MADFTLSVSGMACSGCADSVTKAVQKVAPEAKVTVDLAAGTVGIANAPARAPVEAAIIKAGYEVKA
jgi:copper chaperone